MVDGIYVTLLVGPLVPVPVPRAVLDALTAVEVHTSVQSASGFQLKFSLTKNSPLQTVFLLTGGGGAPPLLRVVIVVTINGVPEVISDGVITQQEITPGAAGAPATLTISGTDLTALMQLVPFDFIPYPALPVEGRVLAILAKYAALGIIPIVIPRIIPDVSNPLDRIHRHKGTDLEYLQELTREAGHVFYLEPGPVPGMNKAYWGPEVRVGVPQPALTVDTDLHTNVEQLGFRFNNERRTMPILFVHNQLTKIPIPIPIPNISLLRPPLGAIPPLPNKFEIINDTAKLSIPQALLHGLAHANRSADSVVGDGTLNVLRYGRLLKARRLVGVRGAGLAFDGLHYVTKVSYLIKRGEYKQTFSLSRDGLVSTVPKVPA